MDGSLTYELQPPGHHVPATHQKQLHRDATGIEADPSDEEFWADVYAMEITSDECLTEFQSLLSCRSNVNAIRAFRGSKAQEFVDFLDQTLGQQHLDGQLWQRSLRLLSKICKARSLIPGSYILQPELIRVGTVRCRGGFADVSDGDYNGLPAAVKRLRVNKDDSDRAFKWLCREIITWKHLFHPNVLPLLGVFEDPDQLGFSILTEWMPNGNIVQFAKSNPDASRLQLLSQAISGVVYLHGLKIVHRDLKGANVLVDGTGTARVADFGLMIMTDLSTTVLSETAVSYEGTYDRMSPELLDPLRFGSTGRPTRESDCYALAMLIYEVLTGLRPFHHIIAYTAVPAILRGERPRKPLEAESLGLSNTLWELLESCWSETSSTRPTAQHLLDYFSSPSLTWVPPPVYPAVVMDVSSITDADSFSSLSRSLTIPQGGETVISIGISLACIFLLLFFLSTC